MLKALTGIVLTVAITSAFLPTWGARAADPSAPGEEEYTPSKLEWAALQLQASHGVTSMNHESPVMISYAATGDGRTILCLLQYTTDYPAAALAVERDAARQVFEVYRESKGWKWLQFRFQERTIEERWPGN